MDDVFYDEPIAPPEKPFHKMTSIGEEGEYELLAYLISVIKKIYYYRVTFLLNSNLQKSENENVLFFSPRGGWGKSRTRPKGRPSGYEDGEFGLSRMEPEVVNSITANDKREVGMGFVGRLFNRSYRSERMNSYVKTQIDSIDDHRFIFTTQYLLCYYAY